MAEGISPSEYQGFRDFLEQACGIVLGENKQYLVASRLKKLQDELGLSTLGQLLDELKRDRSGGVRARVVDAMTTNETYWFRDQQPYVMLAEALVPELLERRPRKLRIWSAACSTGQEPYSIAMALQESSAGRPRTASDVEIVATDISPTVLKHSMTGLYDELALSRGLSAERKQRFFVPDGRYWRVKDECRNLVRFQELNLMKSFSNLGKFHIIFCRNVLIYFALELKRDIISRMAENLEPGGYLLLGGSESLANYSSAFDTVRYKGGLAYRLRPKS